MTTLLARWAPRRKGLTLQPLLDDDRPLSFSRSSYGSQEWDDSFLSTVEQAYRANGIVFACIQARMLPFSEVRFQVQEIVDGRPGKLRNVPSLDILDKPWPNGTTGELLSRMEQDVSVAGNFFATWVGDGSGRRLRRLRPDWVRIITGVEGDPTGGDPYDLDAQVLAYHYCVPGQPIIGLTPHRVIHYSPIPDPLAQWRGMSWLTPLIREVQSDKQATIHKLKFFENGAALGTVIRYDPSVTASELREHIALFNESHRGADKAYSTLHIGGGSDVTVVGTDLKTDFAKIQGQGETRIAAAAGVGAIIARFSEGLAGSALNQGNYQAAVRQFGDMTIRPLWRSAAGALSKLVTLGPDERLWYDARDVEFLKADRKDAAEIRDTTARTIKSLTDAGFTPESVILAVETDDLTRLVHSGLFSVQLRPGGTEITPTEVTP